MVPQRKGVLVARIVDPFGNDVQSEGTTVATITKSLDLPDPAEGRKWGIKVNGELVTHGGVPTGDDVLLEVVDTTRDIDSSELTTTEDAKS